MKGKSVQSSDAAALVATWVSQARRLVVFTGAGMSTESGICDYRSQGGLWDRYTPVDLQQFLSDADARREYWRRKREQIGAILATGPNDGHRVLADWHRAGRLRTVVTQNIDGLHQLAGVPDEAVVEIHGTNRTASCLDCGIALGAAEVLRRLEAGEEAPLCRSCGGLIKPDTISFGQQLDPNVLQRAVDESRECDLMLAMGSTLLVTPASQLPQIAQAEGARLVIVNLSPTPLDDLANLVVARPIGEFLADMAGRPRGQAGGPS